MPAATCQADGCALDATRSTQHGSMFCTEHAQSLTRMGVLATLHVVAADALR